MIQKIIKGYYTGRKFSLCKNPDIEMMMLVYPLRCGVVYRIGELVKRNLLSINSELTYIINDINGKLIKKEEHSEIQNFFKRGVYIINW